MSEIAAESAASPATEKPAARSARAPKQEKPTTEISSINRREFLYYVWGSSMVMLLGGTGGMLLWFMLPRFRAGEFGGDFFLNASAVPAQDVGPADNPQGRFWLSNTEEGVAALYKVCTHLGCLFKWVESNNRFECPCHGSKFDLNGLFIEGPAPRGLDRFAITAVLSDGSQLESDENGFIMVDDPDQVQELIVHTGDKIQGPSTGQDYA